MRDSSLLHQVLAVVLAQLRLEELAGGRARNLRDEQVVLRQPEFREPSFEVRAKIVLGRGLALFEDDRSQRTLVPFWIATREHGRLEHRGMTHERVLERDRAD